MKNYFDDLENVKSILLNDGVILSSTDTVWGLACNSFSSKAVEKVFNIKKRDHNKTCILLVANVTQLKKYIQEIHPRIETLIHFHLRPLSVVYKGNASLPDHLKADDGTVAIRVTKDPMLQEIITLIDKPLVSSSANIQGRPTPATFGEIDEEILRNVDYVFRTNRLDKTKNPPSMLISFDYDGELIFLRK